ncbi:hypothetical protein ACIPSJ_51105 [Streptomyces sp. NPDC090088]|uniref:hypothetical protein n=1 Tax=Streptomyces sp. NPDC090088 TaxID=3365944 RepID=UPI0037F3086D
MPQHLRDMMTSDPGNRRTAQASVVSLTRMMRDEDVGAVLVTEDGHLRCTVIDRDLVVRVFAEGSDRDRTTVMQAVRLPAGAMRGGFGGEGGLGPQTPGAKPLLTYLRDD